MMFFKKFYREKKLRIRIKENFKKNFPSGLMAILILTIFFFMLNLILTQLKLMWDSICHLFPWQIKNQYLEFVAFIISTFIIVWILGAIINLEYRGRSLAGFLHIIFSHIPIVNSVYKYLTGLKKSITGFLKYKTAVCWEVPVIGVLCYGIVTKKVKFIKKFSNNKIEKENRLNVFFPTVPAPITGNLPVPRPEHLWLITNLTLSQIMRLFATGGVDMPDVITLEPLLNRYPDCKIELENNKNEDHKEPKK